MGLRTRTSPNATPEQKAEAAAREAADKAARVAHIVEAYGTDYDEDAYAAAKNIASVGIGANAGGSTPEWAASLVAKLEARVATGEPRLQVMRETRQAAEVIAYRMVTESR